MYVFTAMGVCINNLAGTTCGRQQFECSVEETWWRHQMETFSASLAICAGNSPVPGEFPAQRPVTRSFEVFFDVRLNKRLSKQSRGWWFETPSRSLWRQRNEASCTETCMHVDEIYLSEYMSIWYDRLSAPNALSLFTHSIRDVQPISWSITKNWKLCDINTNGIILCWRSNHISPSRPLLNTPNWWLLYGNNQIKLLIIEANINDSKLGHHWFL